MPKNTVNLTQAKNTTGHGNIQLEGLQNYDQAHYKRSTFHHAAKVEAIRDLFPTKAIKSTGTGELTHIYMHGMQTSQDFIVVYTAELSSAYVRYFKAPHRYRCRRCLVQALHRRK